MNFSILELVLKISAIMALAAAAAGLMRHRAFAASRHLVWTLAVVAVLAVPPVRLLLPSLSIPIAGAVPIAIVKDSPIAPGDHGSAANLRGADSVWIPSSSSNSSNLWNPANLLWLYAAGVLVLLGRLAIEQWKSRRLLARTSELEDGEWPALLRECTQRLGLTRSVRLVRSHEQAMPMTLGVRTPVIVIPMVAEMWDDDRRRAVLLHELAHVVRFYCLTQALAEVAAALYWPHPGSWWMARRLRVERELACDDAVLLSGTEPRDYAAHLLEIAHSLGGHQAPALVVSMARPRQLEGRMLAMLDATRNRATPAASWRLLAVALTLAIVAPIAAATGVAQPAPAPIGRAAPVSAAAAAQDQAVASVLAPGTWQLRALPDGRNVHVTVSTNAHSSHGMTIPIAGIDGLAAMLAGPGGPVHYSLKRDAGAFEFEGTLRSGAGGGTFTFAPSATFAPELVKRGFEKPSLAEQQALAGADVGFAFIDELNAQNYARPALQQLVNLAMHGVTRSYVRDLADLGYRFGNVDELIRQRDHGVDAAYIRAMRGQGLPNLTADDLVRGRDHGVSPEFIADLRQQIPDLQPSIDALVKARDHGVSPEYVKGMRVLGYQLTLDELVAARDHGVEAAYVISMGTVGYSHPTHAQLIQMRDHGITPAFVQMLKQPGVTPPPVERLIQLHDRGLTSEKQEPESYRADLRQSYGFLARLHLAIRHMFKRWMG